MPKRTGPHRSGSFPVVVSRIEASATQGSQICHVNSTGRRGTSGVWRRTGGTSSSREAGPSQRIGRRPESQHRCRCRDRPADMDARDFSRGGEISRSQGVAVSCTLRRVRRMISLPVSRPESIRAKARAREITLHSAILASALWAAVGADVISPGPLGRYSGFQKGNDFVSFYVSGSLARDGNFASLVDATRFHTAQIPLLPKGDTAFFPPLYGPQLALFFSPIARLPSLRHMRCGRRSRSR